MDLKITNEYIAEYYDDYRVAVDYDTEIGGPAWVYYSKSQFERYYPGKDPADNVLNRRGDLITCWEAYLLGACPLPMEIKHC